MKIPGSVAVRRMPWDLWVLLRRMRFRRWYVPWEEPLYTVAEAKEAAAAWGKRTDVYIDTGEWIPYTNTGEQPLAQEYA